MPPRFIQNDRVRPESHLNSSFSNKGYIGVAGSGGANENVISFVLTDFKMDLKTGVLNVTEEMHDSVGAATNNGTSTGSSVRLNGDGSPDAANFYSLGYPTGKVSLRGELPIDGTLALFQNNFAVNADGQEDANRLFEVALSLGTRGSSSGNKQHWLSFKMLYHTFEIDWSQNALHVNFVIKGQLSGVLRSYSATATTHNVRHEITENPTVS
tara:strand:- start:8430 stop:9065 length:636 start_codon:yes stop_codon:yes gene_type:complete